MILKTSTQVFQEKMLRDFKYLPERYVASLEILKRNNALSVYSMEELNYLWTEFSDEYLVSFLVVDEDTITEFIDWLSLKLEY